MDERRKWSPEMELTVGENTVKSVEMTTKNLEYHINLVDKTVTGFERIGSHSERSSTLGMMLSHSVMCCRNHSGKEESINASDFIVVLF